MHDSGKREVDQRGERHSIEVKQFSVDSEAQDFDLLIAAQNHIKTPHQNRPNAALVHKLAI